MQEVDIKKVLEDPQRIFNIARVFHQLLHALDKMEEEKIKEKTKGAQQVGIGDSLEITCKDKEGNIKSHIESKGR